MSLLAAFVYLIHPGRDRRHSRDNSVQGPEMGLMENDYVVRTITWSSVSSRKLRTHFQQSCSRRRYLVAYGNRKATIVS